MEGGCVSLQRSVDSKRSAALSDVALSVTVPAPLAIRLRELAQRDCSSLSATVRRLLAHGVVREFTMADGPWTTDPERSR
jgi:hypothetical protein